MAFNDLVAQKIKDFEQQGIPQVFERDLDLATRRSQSATTSYM